MHMSHSFLGIPKVRASPLELHPTADPKGHSPSSLQGGTSIHGDVACSLCVGRDKPERWP